ncbi:NTPase KAP family P-loop domain-containing protein 1-like [Spea bombifrons]|uniref:NTPase KAP family P-loop domain-containing protein 1-like n=1 Tax=Spea bombifrons TaxID=233779 RepID=UPI0023494FEF|nr:NTPase KAP family P-loop domain-containing protein 1-like [Spea bombifrons]
MVCPDFETKDDVYCFSLAKALYYVSCPVTVGFYAPWGRRKDILLNKVEAYLCAETWKKEQSEVQRNGQRTRKTTGKDLFTLLFLMVFHHPVITEKHKQRKNIRYVFIRFSAWEFAGSDQLWAGLVTTLCDGIEGCFGLVPISLYRVVGRKTKIIDAPLQQEWISKKFLCIPLWLATLLVIILGIGVGALILIFGFPVGNISGDLLSVAEGVGATVVGVSAAGAIRVGILLLKNAIITQKGKVEQKMNRTDMSSQLGFMSDVKREVKVITRYIQLMEVFQRQKIRVVLEITNLDKCMPDKVIGVLNAMNILLSDPKAPFISILAVDPSIIVDCVESSQQLKGMANNGYQFLNRIITLPFSIPKMDCHTKIFILRYILEGKEELAGEMDDGDMALQVEETQNDTEQLLLRHRQLGKNECRMNDVPLRIISSEDLNQSNSSLSEKGPKTKALIEEAFTYLFDDTMKEYITDNVIHIRRAVNTIIITIRLMVRSVPRNKINPQKVTKWVILVTQWPCRLSWVLQCIEDEQQRRSLEGLKCQSRSYSNVSLWDVFEKSLEELDAIKANLKHLLELDGDPEIFHQLLQDNFTVQDVNFFLPYTVNLDYSIKRQLELLRGSNNLWEAKKTNRLTMLSLLNMNIDEVCKEMKKLGFKEENLEEYLQKIKSHNLNGRALVYSDNNEIKEVLGMGLGDWTLFSVYFLGVLPPPVVAPTTAPAYSKPEAPKLGAGSKENILKQSRLSLYISKEDLQ